VTDKLSDAARTLIARPVLATLATVGKDGAPQATPLWIEADGDDLLVNTARGRAKARNIERDPRVALTVIDPDDPYNVVAVQGTIVEVTTEGASAHIDHLAKKYLGVDVYPMHQPGEVRLTIRIRTDRILIQPS
jgi:PPOX class probable F420-dependent enzyme